MTKPTIVVVSGAMHCAEHYKPLMNSLEGKGYRCIFAPLSSTQSIDAPPASLADDTAAIRSIVCSELDNEKNDVLVLAHSYGGVPANNALRDLDEKSRSAGGHTTSVKALACMSSLPIPAGMSVARFVAARGRDESEQPKSAVAMDGTGTFGLPKPSPESEEALYNDLSPEEGRKWTSMLQPTSMRVMGEDTSYAGYERIPMAYLYCSIDETVLGAGQQYVVAEAKKAGATIIHEETVEASHSPFLSQTERTSAFVQRVAEKVS